VAAGTVVLFAVVVEATLRLAGFSYVLYPRDIEFGRPDPVMLETGFLEDPDLFWVRRDYYATLERWRQTSPALIFLGDSCTHLGRYDVELARLVAERQGKPLSYGNLAVAGWSSYQGRRQLERDVLPLAPRVVTLYFGWNDHWIGFGIEDKTVALVKRVFSSGWSRSRIVQLATKATVAMGARRTAYPNRVALDDFRDNLRSMVRQARSENVRPVLITAASAHVEGEEPEELAARWLRDLSELVPLHQSYVAAVREVAAEKNVDLCDAEAQFSALPRDELTALFKDDGIHLTPAGDRRLAEILYGCFEETGILRQVLDD
ncbi:MAG: GDSL-type esterase/lipase family protein, partial [Thermoanaerobaculia bacterium]